MSITLRTNVLSVYQAQTTAYPQNFHYTQVARGSTQKCAPHFQELTSSCFKQSKVQNRWNNTPERTKVLESGEKSRSWNQNKNFELALLISAS